MFLDKVVLSLKGGKGGNGVVAWRREKYLPKGGPYGGNGGGGGSVIIRADDNIFSLEAYRNKRLFQAEKGQDGGYNNRTGRNGRNLILKIPAGTVLKSFPSQEIIHDFGTCGEELVICRGGCGGKGNTHFKSSTNRAPTQATPGTGGQEIEIEFELKTIADVGLIGFPNSGKSTLLNTLCSRDVKTGAYPFTTLRPEIGFVSSSGRNREDRLIVADIPGIIKDAHRNKGLGFEFLRHIERTRLLLFVVDVSGFTGNNPVEDLENLVRELSLYRHDLLNKESVVALNKIDLLEDLGEVAFRDVLSKFQDLFVGMPFIPISGLTGEGLDVLTQVLKQKLKP
ncbi:MAG: Obg family GTPase CgtA [Victivallaceae bacterium]